MTWTWGTDRIRDPKEQDLSWRTPTQSRDIGLVEDRDTHSPIRSLDEYFVMKRAIKQWTSAKHPNYNLVDARLDSFTNWPGGLPSPKSLSEDGFFFTGKYKTIFSLFQFFKKILFSLIPKNFDISGRGDNPSEGVSTLK